MTDLLERRQLVRRERRRDAHHLGRSDRHLPLDSAEDVDFRWLSVREIQ